MVEHSHLVHVVVVVAMVVVVVKVYEQHINDHKNKPAFIKRLEFYYY